MGYYNRRSSLYPRYVSVAERHQKAKKYVNTIAKKGAMLNPVVIEGRTIAKTFWGKAWCSNLESYSDYENRLPRGRTYVRNGSVIDLRVEKGKIFAQVMGSSLYQVEITMAQAAKEKWEKLINLCSGKIDSLVELLQGRFSGAVMEILTAKESGLFPSPKEIQMRCSCPDIACMCKHIAATLYGIGALLDTKPENLFVLRHVDHMDLITKVGVEEALLREPASVKKIDEADLSSIFGIEMDGKQVPSKKNIDNKNVDLSKKIRVKKATAKKKLTKGKASPRSKQKKEKGVRLIIVG